MSSKYSWEFKDGIILYRCIEYSRQAIPLKSVVSLSIHQESVDIYLTSGQKVSLGKDYYGCTYSDVLTAIWNAFLKMHSTPDTVKDLLTLETS